jgi:hypothetical protein
MSEGWHFGVGAIAFGVAEGIWLLGHFVFGFPSLWVLEPTSGIVFCALVLTLSAITMAATRGDGLTWLQSFSFMSIGAYGTLTVLLFLVGPGNLWPLVLLIDGVLIIPALFVGALLGDLLRDVRRRTA